MDAGGQNHYLHEIMTRQLFAFLALLTGLAAFGSPAEASLTQPIACDSSIAAGVACDATCSEASRAERPSLTIRTRQVGDVQEISDAVPATSRVPVLMGIERAFE